MSDGDVPIIEPRNMALYDTLGYANAITPAITIEHHDELSYDITYTFKNVANKARPIGRLEVGIFGLGERLRVLDHAGGMAWRDIDHDDFEGFSWGYPGLAYSPVMVAMNQTHVVGVSLLYPVMDYKHDAAVRLHRVGGVFRGPRERLGWMISFDLNNIANSTARQQLIFGAMVQPGETRQYTLAVRAMARPTATSLSTGTQEWLGVLEPYRAYFQSQYGGVTYDRRTEPVMAWGCADPTSISPTNRRGFGGLENRPDRVGFAPMADRIARTQMGYDGVMVWTPSGLFAENQDLNYPFLFTAGWLDNEKLRTATDWIGFPAVARSGKQLGLWWGRAAQYMDRWDDDEAEFLDPSNPQHMNMVHLQLDLAEQAGATMIGLDAFTHERLPSWEQVDYLTSLQGRYPQMSFIVEPMCSDIVHRVAPTFVRAWQVRDESRREEDFHRVPVPHYLSDLVLPGHETWAYFRYDVIARVAGQRVDSDRVQRDVERLARNGYVPIVASEYSLRSPQLATADATWLTTVPGALRDADDSTDTGGSGNTGGNTGGDGGDGKSGDGGGSDGDSGDTGGQYTPPGGDSGKPVSKPDDHPEPRKVFVITLPDGRRLKIVTKR